MERLLNRTENRDNPRAERGIEFKWIETERLKPNPWNPNRMSPERAGKLKAEIKNAGMILPIVVRHIRANDRQECLSALEYQIIDGEHRWLIAMELGMGFVPCIVVELDENEARIKTIQLNRLRGEDEPELLARLLRELEIEMGLEEISARLPFDRVEIEESLELVELETSEESRKKLEREMSEMLKDRIFSIIVSEQEKASIERAIHLFNSRSETGLRPGSALARICEAVIKNDAIIKDDAKIF